MNSNSMSPVEELQIQMERLQTHMTIRATRDLNRKRNDRIWKISLIGVVVICFILAAFLILQYFMMRNQSLILAGSLEQLQKGNDGMIEELTAQVEKYEKAQIQNDEIHNSMFSVLNLNVGSSEQNQNQKNGNLNVEKALKASHLHSSP
jgi:hypothetical protein